ncbi:TrmB family transcriptional regulator [Halorussus sp. MSC15.2]|uniref:TrmB family transcriptional regulator n=1 Tax=Halorussus sp. MSC15.2 TaxID=2283638 RepID=UPI0013D7B101|nr:TrmB family transcriptional regulator [Halorussus sp. MSC15.2]NEU58225.1 TrmB family transcriptional regulator [Halorussus sp. MSC15.2]
MDDAETAIDSLEQLGLTEYEARCFVALTRLPHATAKEVGQVADIPRSRVYETMDRLQERGLVEIQEGEPRTFQSVSIDTAVRVLRKEYDSHFETMERSLRRMEPIYKEVQQAVWALSDHEQVTERVVDLVSEASDEIVLVVLDDALLDDELLAYLTEADERGVAINVGTVVDSVRERVADAEFDASVFSTGLIEWFQEMSGAPRVGRLLMVDRGPVLVSALHDERLPGVPNETAAWSDGINHGMATFTERVLTYELQENVEEVYSRGSSESGDSESGDSESGDSD